MAPSAFSIAGHHTSQVVFASAIRDTDENSADLRNVSARGVHLIIDVTAEAGTHSLIVTIEGKDPVSGKYYTILASAAITAVGTTVLRVYPGLVAVASLTVNDVLPLVWRVVLDHTKTASSTFTMSVGANLLN